MSATITPTESQIFTGLRAFLLSELPTGLEVIKAEVSRVPEPEGTEFVILTPMHRDRIAQNIDTYGAAAPTAPLTLKIVTQPTMVGIQIDVHGTAAAENSSIISSLLRDPVACDYLVQNGYAFQPLYADDAKQMPFINAEQQYETRYVIQAEFQANFAVTIGQQFADTLTPVLYAVGV